MQCNRRLEGLEAVNKSNCQPWCCRVKTQIWRWLEASLFWAPRLNGVKWWVCWDKNQNKSEVLVFCRQWASDTRGGHEQTGNNSTKKNKKNISGVLITVSRQINPGSTAPFRWQQITNKHLVVCHDDSPASWWCLHTVCGQHTFRYTRWPRELATALIRAPPHPPPPTATVATSSLSHFPFCSIGFESHSRPSCHPLERNHRQWQTSL